MTTRRLFIASICAFAVSHKTYSKSRQNAFEEELKAEVECVLKKHAHEKSNESTCTFIEAEIDDWAHIYVMDGELDMFNVQCGFVDTDAGEERWVQCMFKKHGAEEVKVLKCEMPV